MTPVELEWLIVGTGRSGTRYAAHALDATLGAPVGHEYVCDVHSALRLVRGEWTTEDQVALLDRAAGVRGESSWLALPFLMHGLIRARKVIHVMRHPVLVMRSWLTQPPMGAFLEVAKSTLGEETVDLDWMAARWIAWNESIRERVIPEAKQWWTWRVDVDGLPDGWSRPPVEGVARNRHVRVPQPVRLDRLTGGLPDALRRECKHYGYDLYSVPGEGKVRVA